MSDCVFCGRIRRGEYEAWAPDPSVVWFEPLNPVTPGHLLFVPVHHVTGAGDPRNGPYETAITMEVAARWAQRNGVQSFNLITSVGAEATQSVRHLHVHLLPRREGDGLVFPWTGQAEREGRLAPCARIGGCLAETGARCAAENGPQDPGLWRCGCGRTPASLAAESRQP